MSSVKDVRVCCDEDGCGWSQDVSDLDVAASYHRQPCPQCGKGEIVSDEDLLFIRSFQGLAKASQEIEDKSPGPHTYVEVRYDTAALRKEKP